MSSLPMRSLLVGPRLGDPERTRMTPLMNRKLIFAVQGCMRCIGAPKGAKMNAMLPSEIGESA